MATKALQMVVKQLDQFEGRDISKYLRYYVSEMELSRVYEEEMIETFELAVVPKIREHVKSLRERFGDNWEMFSHALEEEYFLEDTGKITKHSFFEWVEKQNKNLSAIELLREFKRKFSQLTRIERLTLEGSKIILFLRAADEPLQEKLELLYLSLFAYHLQIKA